MPRIKPPNADLFMSPVFAKTVETWSWADADRLETLIAKGIKVMSTREDARVIREMQQWLIKLRQRPLTLAATTPNIQLS